VILDVSMPVMNDLELLGHLLASHPIPIIFITARDRKAPEQALRSGAISFLTNLSATRP
jgi:CheY-like chemotaxis protein